MSSGKWYFTIASPGVPHGLLISLNPALQKIPVLRIPNLADLVNHLFPTGILTHMEIKMQGWHQESIRAGIGRTCYFLKYLDELRVIFNSVT